MKDVNNGWLLRPPSCIFTPFSQARRLYGAWKIPIRDRNGSWWKGLFGVEGVVRSARDCLEDLSPWRGPRHYGVLGGKKRIIKADKTNQFWTTVLCKVICDPLFRKPTLLIELSRHHWRPVTDLWVSQYNEQFLSPELFVISFVQL